MNKESFSDKAIKRFYGITGPLDEQKRQTADHMGNIAFMWLFWILIIGNAIALSLAFRWPQVTAVAYPILVEMAVLGLAVYIVRSSRKSGVDELELELQTAKERKALRYAGLKAGLTFGLLFHLLFSIMTTISDSQDLMQTLLLPRYLLTSLLAASFFGLVIHMVVRSKIRRAQKREEEDQ